MQFRTAADRLADFKKAVQFQEKLVQREKHEQVCVDWEKLAAPDVMSGWIVTDQTKEFSAEYTSYSWVFQQDANYMVANILVYPSSANTAPEAFLEIADSTSMKNIPYVAGPDALGTVSAISPQSPPKLVFWFFRNILFKIPNASKFDPLPLAGWLQKQAEQHTCPIIDEK